MRLLAKLDLVFGLLLIDCGLCFGATVGELEPLEIRAERFERLERSVSIGESLVRETALPSAAELLRQQEGVNFSSYFGSFGLGTPQLRGFGENASSRVLILVDGLPMNRPDLAAPVWFEFPLAGLKRVELARGSRTVRYGSGALAGVIAFENGAAIDRPEFHSISSLGSWGSRLVRAQGGLSLGDHGQLRAHIDHFRTDGYRENAAVSADSFGFGILKRPTNELEWRVALSRSLVDYENPGGLSDARYRSDPRQSVYERFGVADQYVNELESLRITQQVRASNWKVNFSWSGRERELNFGAGSHTDHEIDSWGIDLSVHGGLAQFSWEAGLRGREEHLSVDRFRDIERQDRFASAQLDQSTLGAFVQLRRDLTDHACIGAGLCWDLYRLDAETQDDSALANPLLNYRERSISDAWAWELFAEFELSKNSQIWLRYDHAFRFPLTDEVASYQGFLQGDSFNAELEPELSHAVEMGASYESGSFDFIITGFSQWMEGEILYDFQRNLNVNFDATWRLGSELRLRWEGEHWSSRLNYQWVRAQFIAGNFSGKTLPLVSDHSLTAQIEWRPAESWRLALEADFVSDAVEGNDFENRFSPLPARCLFHVEARYRISEHFELFGRVENLLDQAWASLKYQGQWYPGGGRQMSFGLRSQF